jgi:hypothetical protein
MLDMQTRQNIAEALAASGQLVVVTPQEFGLVGAAAIREAARGRALADAASATSPQRRLWPGGALLMQAGACRGL